MVGPVAAGDEVSVVDPEGRVLGRGLYSPNSAIRVRLYTRQAERALDRSLLLERLQQALERRKRLGLPGPGTNAFRVLNGEGDDLPGLIVDQLGDVIALQFSSIGMKLRERSVVDAVQELLRPTMVLDRTPAKAAELEGFELGAAVVAGDRDVSALRFSEAGIHYELPLTLGQKTGFYLDQRALRARLRCLAKGRRVLDCYSYVGASGLSMARGGAAEVLSIDSSAAAVAAGKQCVVLNGLEGVMRIAQGDARRALAAAAASGGYALVLCDPPILMPRRSAYAKAQKALERLARAAAAATRPGGPLGLCSCSAGLGLAERGRALWVGARLEGRRATIIDRVFQDADHPVPAAFPEGLYLSSVLAEIETHR